MDSSALETIARCYEGKLLANGSWQLKCPCHEDKRASLNMRLGDDGKVLLYCFAGCSFPDLAKKLEIPLGNALPSKRTLEKIYPYLDANGIKRYEVLRFRYPDGSKDFLQRQSDQVWNLQGVEPLPYRLPEVIKAIAVQKQILWVEGEKDADTLAALGYTATTNHGGANKPHIVEKIASYFKGADVWVFPDNDKPKEDGKPPTGIAHAEQVCKALKTIGANKIFLVKIPEPHKDISDYLLGFVAKEQAVYEILELIDKATEWGLQKPIITISVPDLLGDSELLPRSYLPMPFRSISALGGFCEIMEKTKMTAVIGPSGGQKTTFIECIVTAWLQAGYSGAMFGPEWSSADMLRRAIQRLGGPSYVKVGKHLAYKADVSSLPVAEQEFAKKRAFAEGKYPLSAAEENTMLDLKREIQSWPGNLYVLRPSMNFKTTIEQFQAAQSKAKERCKPLDFIVLDYIQVAGNDYEEIMTAISWTKTFCMTGNLHGLASSQMVKSDSRANRQGQAVGSEAMAYASDAAFNSAYVLNRPVDSDNHYLDKIKVRVTKNSMGQSGIETMLDYNPLRLLLTDPAQPNIPIHAKGELLESWSDR